MTMVRIEILPIHPQFGSAIPHPKRMSDAAAGFDLHAAIEKPIELAPTARTSVPCGFAMACPPGFEAQIRPRSGLAAKHGVTVLNSPGTIDADYRGEVMVLLINLGEKTFVIEPAMRIAQMVVAAVTSSKLEFVPELNQTNRGVGGFGSTGTR